MEEQKVEITRETISNLCKEITDLLSGNNTDPITAYIGMGCMREWLSRYLDADTIKIADAYCESVTSGKDHH